MFFDYIDTKKSVTYISTTSQVPIQYEKILLNIHLHVLGVALAKASASKIAKIHVKSACF